MAIKQLILSDISGLELEEDNRARVEITHPGYRFTAGLDISLEEAEAIQGSLTLVTIRVFEPNKPPRVVVVESKGLSKLFGGVDVETLIETAPRLAEASFTAKPSGKPKSAGKAPKQQGEPKANYRSPEWAGVEHRGRVTEDEAMFVRNNLALANENRAREGQAPIDPKDPKMIKRYGLE